MFNGTVYDFDELDELQHAYAITVHRSQGSEYPAVVVPLTMSAYPAAAQPALHGGHPGQTPGRAGRQPQSPGHRGPHRRHRPPAHRPHPPPPAPERDETLIVTPPVRAAGHYGFPGSARSGQHSQLSTPDITGDTMARASLRALEAAYGAPAGPSAWRRSARLQVPPQLRPGICWLLSRRSCGTRSPPRSERDLCSTRDAR